MPKLTVTLQDGTQHVHELIDEQITFGRAPDNTMVIEDASVSSHHGTLTLQDGDYVLRDIGSTNGSRLNGKDLATDTDYHLQDGDFLRLGKVEATYESENKVEGRPMPEAVSADLSPASSSAAPTNFTNASPFQTKKKKKDPAGAAILALSIIALLAFVGVMLKVLSLQSPLQS
jgi:pSer/pThr/pTyr-binding forkhead associated (FHA) protein